VTSDSGSNNFSDFSAHLHTIFQGIGATSLRLHFWPHVKFFPVQRRKGPWPKWPSGKYATDCSSVGLLNDGKMPEAVQSTIVLNTITAANTVLVDGLTGAWR